MQKCGYPSWGGGRGGRRRCVLVEEPAELRLYLVEKRFLYFCLQRKEIQERGGKWFNVLA